MSAGGQRRLRIIERLAGPDGDVTTARLGEVSAELIDVDGAGVMLMTGDVASGSVVTSNDVAALIEDLQYTLGEGPCVDAYRLSEPVMEADLAAPAGDRWPGFTPAAVAGGVRAIFGFPIRVGAIRLGALNLHRSRAGPLTDDQHANALVMADVVGEVLLALQAEAPVGKVSADLEANANFRFVVAQASGMIAVQLDVSLAQALIRLRGYAFAEGRVLDEVAADVVARRLHFGGRRGE